ncbi:MAG: cell division protein FtsQ/DivIB [Pseudobdellovibrio sp.]
MRKFLKLTVAFMLFPLVVALSAYSLDQQGFFKIDKIEFKVDTLSSQKNFVAPRVAALKKKLEVIRGISLWKAPLSEISKMISEEKWIKHFQLSRVWPSGVLLDIQTDDVAILVLPQADEPASIGEVSEMKPITKTGQILQKINSKEAPNAIVTHDSDFLISQKVREGGLNVINSLPTTGKMTASQVSEIGYDRKEGYWIKLLNSETKVNFGEEQFEIKSARLSQVIDYLESRSLKARVIDANLSKKVLVRLQQSP